MNAAPEDIRAASMYKKMVPFVMDISDPNDQRLKSARDHYRYDTDISQSLFISLDIEQFMMRKKMPQVMATVQCVNHTGSKLCSPGYDSFLTLFKQLPDSDVAWDQDWDEDEEKTD